MSTFTASPVVTEITRQLNALGVNLRGTRLVQVDENTLRVSKTTGRKTKNVDIAYNPVFDLYDVTVHEFTSPEYQVKSKTTTMVYADQLPDAVTASKAA